MIVGVTMIAMVGGCGRKAAPLPPADKGGATPPASSDLGSGEALPHVGAAGETVTVVLGATVAAPVGTTPEGDAPAFQTLTFVQVVEDSRCPASALCVWPGRVVVEVQRTHPVARFSPQKLTLGPDSPVEDRRAGPFELVAVEPYPGTAEAPEPVRARFVVLPHEGAP